MRCSTPSNKAAVAENKKSRKRSILSQKKQLRSIDAYRFSQQGRNEIYRHRGTEIPRSAVDYIGKRPLLRDEIVERASRTCQS
jgi:hypothetical protein